MSHVVLLEKPASVVNGDMGYFDANGKFVKVGGSLATGKVPQRQSDGTIQWATLASGMTNPMTTADDIIVGGASGAPARVAKGSNNTVWGVNGSGVLGYKADPAGGGVGTVTGIYGALGLSFDPTQVGAGAAFAAGSQHFIKVPIQRTGTISKVGLMLFVVGSGTAANCFVSVHNSSGVMLGLSADLATQWTTSVQRFDQWTVTPVGAQSLAVTAADGAYMYVGVLVGTQSGTPIQFGRVNGNAFYNQVGSAGLRFGVASGGPYSAISDPVPGGTTADYPWFASVL
jgi:hypothetical protein